MTPVQREYWERRGWKVLDVRGGDEIVPDGPTIFIEETTGLQWFVDPADWPLKLQPLDNGRAGVASRTLEFSGPRRGKVE